MKIEEAKEAIKASSKAMTDINAMHSFGHIPCKQAIPVNDVINIIDQIETDQPKLVVPQFVAEWYEEHKDKLEEELCYQIWLIRESGAETDFEYWLTETENPIQTLINMHQFGYTVKLYTVEILGNKLYKMTSDNHTRYRFFHKTEALPFYNFYEYSSKLTESEVKASDERLWQFAEEVTE